MAQNFPFDLPNEGEKSKQGLPNENLGNRSFTKLQTDVLYDLSMIITVGKNDKDFVGNMIEIFFEQVQTCTQQLNVALAANDFMKVSAVAHRIKPSINIMGIVSLKDEVQLLEKIAKETNAKNEIEALINVIVDGLKNVVDKLKTDPFYLDTFSEF